MMGLIAWVPTIAGTWIGGFLYSPLAAVVFLSVGAGTIFQIVHHQKPESSLSITAPVVAGFITGLFTYGLTYMMDAQL